MFEELDTIKLTHDIKKRGLKKGDLGAIVNVYNDGEAYEVEFVSPNGRTKVLLALMPNDVCLHMRKDEHDFFWSNTPTISFSTISGTTLAMDRGESTRENCDTLIKIAELQIRTESLKSEAKIKEFHYPVLTL